MTVSMMCRILVIISPATLTAPVRHPLGVQNFFDRGADGISAVASEMWM